MWERAEDSRHAAAQPQPTCPGTQAVTLSPRRVRTVIVVWRSHAVLVQGQGGRGEM